MYILESMGEREGRGRGRGGEEGEGGGEGGEGRGGGRGRGGERRELLDKILIAREFVLLAIQLAIIWGSWKEG